MDLESNPDVLLVRKHLVEHLGAPSEVFEVRGSPLPTSPVQVLHIAYFAPGGPDAPVVFATCGASLFRMSDGRRVEAIMLFRREPTNEAFQSIHKMLASFAIFAEANEEVVRIGDVVHAQQDLQKFSQMDAILFLPPVPFIERFHRVTVTEQGAVDLVWLLPVYEAEADYALKHGPQALMMLFAAQSLDLTDTNRDEANTLIAPDDARTLAEKRSEEDKKRAQQEAQRPNLSSGNPRPARRLGGPTGSAELQDQGDTVAIVRRGEKKPKGDTTIERAMAPAPEPPPPAPKLPPPRTAPPPRSPIRPAAKPEAPVRFDLGGASAPPAAPPQRRPGQPQQKAPAPPIRAERAAPPPPETPEQKAEAKRKRVEELKAKAQEAARRAAEAKGGDPEKPKG